MRLVLRHRVASLDSQGIQRVVRGMEDSVDWTLTDLPGRTGLAPATILAVFLCVEADRPGSLWFRIYHTCEAHPIETRPFRSGMPRGPYRCPGCEQTVPSDSLSMDISCRVNESLEIVRVDS